MRLFCFPYAGGTASAFFDWRKRADSTLDICPIEYPGRGSRWNQPFCETLDSLEEIVLNSIRPELHEPYALLGHSFGATVAFQVAHHLNRLGHALPVRLFISASRAPHLPHTEFLHDLTDEEFLRKLMGYDGVPQEVVGNDELLSLLLPVVRADFRIYERHEYRPVNPLPVPISVFGGLHDPKVPPAELLAWQQHTTKSFRCRFFSGKHFFLFDPQFCLGNIQEDIDASLMAVSGALYE